MLLAGFKKTLIIPSCFSFSSVLFSYHYLTRKKIIQAILKLLTCQLSDLHASSVFCSHFTNWVDAVRSFWHPLEIQKL